VHRQLRCLGLSQLAEHEARGARKRGIDGAAAELDLKVSREVESSPGGKLSMEGWQEKLRCGRDATSNDDAIEVEERGGGSDGTAQSDANLAVEAQREAVANRRGDSQIAAGGC
jgi:hypothetical protein